MLFRSVGGRNNNDIFSSEKLTRKASVNRACFSSKIISSNSKNNDEYFKDENGKIRGIITTSSYEARAFGVKTAMSVNEALRFCPHLKMIAPNYELYDNLSNRLKELLELEIPIIEQFSIDEFFGDLSGYIEEDEAFIFARNLKIKIFEKLGLPASIGVAPTKYLSKLMTNFAKPNGVKLLKKDDIEEFTKDVLVENFTGIGKSFCEKLRGYNIKTLGDIRNNQKLLYSWGKIGVDTYNRVCGIRDNKLTIEREKKSIGIGRTFDAIFDRNELKRRVMILCRYLCFLVKKENVNPLTYAIKIRYEYRIKSKDYINVNRIFNEIDFKNEMVKLFEKTDNHKTHEIGRAHV